MELTPAMERYILHWGEMGTRWGVNRSVAQIHALLYLSTIPLSAEEIADTLSIARSNVSTSLKELQSYGVVTVTQMLGDRRDYFESEKDILQLAFKIADARKRREIDPTLSTLRQCLLDAKEDENPEVVERIQNMANFLEVVSNWYDDMRKLSPSTLIKLIKLGAKVGRFVSMKG